MKRLVWNGRRRVAGFLTTLCVAGLTGATLSAAPSGAEPSIEDAKSSAERLYHEAEQASERYNDARIELQQARARYTALQKDLARQQAVVDAIRDRVAAVVVAQYQGQALSAASQAILSDDPDAFLDQLTTMSEVSSQQGAVAAQLVQEADALEAREKVAAHELAQIERTRDVLAKEHAIIQQKADEAEKLLSRLESERAARASRSSSRLAVSSAPVSGRAAAAVNYALAQVGDAYSWGAAGPNAFDCSGLTMAAWAQAGVALPHSSSGQTGSGARISSSALQPGDLVFYYQPVSHVGIYIGNGQMVHAANPREGVRVAPVFSMPYSGAVRPG